MTEFEEWLCWDIVEKVVSQDHLCKAPGFTPGGSSSYFSKGVSPLKTAGFWKCAVVRVILISFNQTADSISIKVTSNALDKL